VIGLIRTAFMAVSITLLYSARIMWAYWRKSPTLAVMSDWIPYRWSDLILRAAGTKVELVGGEAIDPERGQVLVSNHVSWFDVLALCWAIPAPVRFVGKMELMKVPVFGPAWAALGNIAIDRGDRTSAMESLAVARRRIEEIHPTLVFFPEGTRSPTGELRAFKKGAFVLAIQTGVDVVPAAVVGSREVMAKGSLRIRMGRTIQVRLGRPIPVAGLTVEDRGALTERARRAVLALQGAAPAPDEEDNPSA
jgi:1-acyl-sn-glycerol-3-phosphate acyltransferase